MEGKKSAVEVIMLLYQSKNSALEGSMLHESNFVWIL